MSDTRQRRLQYGLTDSWMGAGAAHMHKPRTLRDVACAWPAQTTPRQAEVESDVTVASRLEGKAVRDPAGELVGRVRHVLLDLAAGRIAFLVIELEGSRLLCAVPWAAFGPEPSRLGLVLAYTLEDLGQAPTFRVDQWPALGNPEWLQAVYRFFAAPPHWNTAGS